MEEVIERYLPFSLIFTHLFLKFYYILGRKSVTFFWTADLKIYLHISSSVTHINVFCSQYYVLQNKLISFFILSTAHYNHADSLFSNSVSSSSQIQKDLELQQRYFHLFLGYYQCNIVSYILFAFILSQRKLFSGSISREKSKICPLRNLMCFQQSFECFLVQ